MEVVAGGGICSLGVWTAFILCEENILCSVEEQSTSFE